MEESIKICVTCLSTDRRLSPVLSLSALLEEIHFEELKESSGEVCWECWSILVKFQRFKKRAKMAQETLSRTMEHSNLKSLTTLTKTNIIFTEYDYSYNFNYEINNHNSIKEERPDQSDDEIDQIYDQFNQNHDTLDIEEDLIAKPVKNENAYSEADILENKHNINMLVKHEYSLEDKEKMVSETYKPSEHTEELETVETKPNKKLLNKSVKSQKKDLKKISQIALNDIDDIEFEEKFLQVVLTEEEMLQGREEKRCHPSFRTLPFICNGCLLGFRKEVKYRIHMKKKHDEHIGNFSCNICDVRFPHNLALSKHKRKHYVVYRCKLCRYQGNDLRSAVNHCKIKHAGDKPDSIHCSQCKFVAKNSQDLERHIETEHRFWCNECGEKFTLKKNMRIHLTRTHAPVRAFKCDICKKGFKTKAQLESHMARHNESIAKKLSYCEECNIQYKTIVIYRSHLKNTAHHSEGTAYNYPMADKSDKRMDLTDMSLPSRSNAPVETQDAAASTSATPFAKPPTIAAPKSSAQRQREYRQRIAASRTPAQSIATRISETERKRNYRLRKAANLALASGSLQSTTAYSSRSAGRSNNVQYSTQRQLTNQQRQSLTTTNHCTIMNFFRSN